MESTLEKPNTCEISIGVILDRADLLLEVIRSLRDKSNSGVQTEAIWREFSQLLDQSNSNSLDWYVELMSTGKTYFSNYDVCMAVSGQKAFLKRNLLERGFKVDDDSFKESLTKWISELETAS